MNKIVSPVSKSFIKNLIPYSQFEAIKEQGEVLVVEIGKEPQKLFKNGLWIGYRNGGMASWLAALMPHLPHKKFCVYMDEGAYRESQYMYSYYSEYFSKLFHSQYLGTCVHPRQYSNPKFLKNLNEVKAQKIPTEIINNAQFVDHTVLLDFRNSDSATKDCLTKEVRKYKNASYLNVPLNDDDLPQLLHSKTSHLPKNTKFITLCAKGYRSLIGYSFLELIKKPSWEVQLCRSPFQEVKKQITKPLKKQINFWELKNQTFKGKAAYAMI